MPICYVINWNYIIIGSVISAIGFYILGLMSGYLLGQKSKEVKIKVEEKQ